MDIDGDGQLDIISGCYWTSGEDGGHIQILRGTGSMQFAEAESLKNRAGGPLQNISFEGQEKSGGMYEDQTSTICTQQHAVDYDGDGDLDLVVGCFGSKFFYYENHGSADDWQMSESPEQLSVEISGHHAAPHLVDWDGDGDLDLLSGSAGGGVTWSENTGSAKKPSWSEFQPLITDITTGKQTLSGDKQPSPSTGTRVWAYDWNRDGKLDLLVGDQSMISRPNEDLSEEELAAAKKEHRDAESAAMKKYQALIKQMQKVSSSQDDSEEAKDKRETLNQDLRAASNELRAAQQLEAKYQTSETTGFVWLYLQK